MPNEAPQIFKALLAAQGEFETLKKTETAEVVTKSGAKFSYGYVDLKSVLDHVLPILHKHGLVLVQATDIGDVPALVTEIFHAETGESVKGIYPLVSVEPNDPQKVGASMTFARRYALLGMLGIATEDDDAASATTPRAATVDRSTGEIKETPKKAFDAMPSDGPSCPKCGGDMWDNRDKKTNPKAPDFRCKDKENCDGVIWPGDTPEPVEPGMPEVAAPTADEFDKYIDEQVKAENT